MDGRKKKKQNQKKVLALFPLVERRLSLPPQDAGDALVCGTRHSTGALLPISIAPPSHSKLSRYKCMPVLPPPPPPSPLRKMRKYVLTVNATDDFSQLYVCVCSLLSTSTYHLVVPTQSRQHPSRPADGLDTLGSRRARRVV